MSGTFSNIEVGNVTAPSTAFYSYTSLTGRYENIKIGDCQTSFGTAIKDIDGYFDTIELGDVSIQAFSSGNYLYGNFKNITINNSSSSILFSSTNNTNGTFENIIFNGGNDIFGSTNGNLYGTFSNITSYGLISTGFTPGSGNISGYLKDITLGTVSNFMGAANFTLPVTIDNLKVKSYIQAVFPGKIIDSFIDARSFANSAITLDTEAIVERCKFLSDTDITSISSPGLIMDTQISFTITNYGITSSITNAIGTPLNIDNPNIT
jgi:hypothetical protein